MELHEEIVRCIWQDSNVEWGGNIYNKKRDKILLKKNKEGQFKVNEDIISVRKNFSKFKFSNEVSGIRFCLFSDIRKGDMFKDYNMVMALFLGKPLEEYFEIFRKYCKKNNFEFQIAHLNIYKGLRAKLIKTLLAGKETVYAGIMEPETVFYATDVSYGDLYGRKVKIVNVGITFETMEETYREFKDKRNVTMDELHAYEEMD